MIDYKGIFDKVEKSLKKQSLFTEDVFDKQYGLFKELGNKKNTDKEIFGMLIMVVFYSGFRASTVEKKEKTILKYFSDYKIVFHYTEDDIREIMSDKQMIKNEKKIIACINNAKVFNNIVSKYKSFQKYLDSFDANSSLDNLILLKEELKYKFYFLGNITVYHFLTDLGFNVLKPDRVILRIFKRLGLIESEKQLLKTVIQGRKFSEKTGLPIRYIDIIFVKYGQKGESNRFGLEDGICLEKTPKCNICELRNICSFERKC